MPIKFHSYELLSEYPELAPKVESEQLYAEKFVQKKLSELRVGDADVNVFVGSGGLFYSGKCGVYSGEVMLNQTALSFSSKDLAALATSK